jgi:hypothetical protein
MSTPPNDAAIQFLLCESVRQEQGGKLTLLGFFPGSVIVVPPTTETITFPLAFLFITNDGDGLFSVRVTLIRPSGAVEFADQPIPDVTKEPGKPMTALVQFLPFHTSEFGGFKILLKLNDALYERIFTIQKEPLPA